MEEKTKKVNAVSKMLPAYWLLEALSNNDLNAGITEMQEKWWDKNSRFGITKHFYETETDLCSVSIVYKN